MAKRFLPHWLKLWAPPLIGIPAMLILSYWFELARFFLFAHHLFWAFSLILLINPVSETLWPSAEEEKKQPPAPKARRRAAHKPMAEQRYAPAPETPAERLTRLRKQKEALDQKIEQLTAKDNSRKK